MTITTPRYQQATYFSSGSGTVPVPAGSVAGELALLSIDGLGSSKRAPVDMTGWLSKVHTYSTDTYWTLLTSGMISGGIPITGYIGFLTVYPGAGRVGNVTDLGNTTPGCNLSVPGSWLHVHGRGDSALNPATGKLGADVTLTAYSSRRYNVWAQAETTVKYATLAGTFNGKDSNGFEIVPLEAPGAPTILSPSTGVTIPYNEALTVLFQHNSRRAAPMSSFRAKVVDGGTTYYVTAAGALTTTLTTLSGSAGTVTIANTAMTTGKTYDLSIATSEDGVVFSDYSPVVTLYTVGRPTVDSVTVTSPAGSLAPTVAYTATTSGGVVSSRVRICLATDAAPTSPLWDSGVMPGSGLNVTTPVRDTWPNGVNLKAWVEVQQPGLWSTPVASSSFPVSWTPPTAPSTVTAANQSTGPLQVTVAGVVVPVHGMTNLVPNGGFELGSTGWDTGSGMGTIDAGRMACLRTPGTAAQVRRGFILTSGHKYYAAATFTGGSAGNTAFYLLGASSSTTASAERLSRIVTGGGALTWLEFQDGRSTGTLFYVDNVIMIDLTAEWGAGNEPTKAAMDSLLATWANSWFDGTYDPSTGHSVQVQASTDAGATWSDVAFKVPASSTVVVDVPSAKYGVSTLYRARAKSPFLGAPLWSAWTTSAAAVASTDRTPYIISQDLDSYVAVRLRRGSSTRSRPQGFSAFYAFGAEAPTVFRTPPAGFSGSELVGVSSYAALASLEAILDGDDPWWWRWSPELDSTGTLVDQPATLATLNGELNYQRLAESISTDRLVPLVWVEQV